MPVDSEGISPGSESESGKTQVNQSETEEPTRWERETVTARLMTLRTHEGLKELSQQRLASQAYRPKFKPQNTLIKRKKSAWYAGTHVKLQS